MANLYELLMIPRTATKDQIATAFKNKAKYYDPAITGDKSTLQEFFELKLAFTTLMDDEKRNEYDDYLSSLGAYRSKEKEADMDPEEIERRRRERGKKRFMEDFDFANEEFFNMWKERAGGQAGNVNGEGENTENLNFNGKDISLKIKVKLEEVLFTEELKQ